MTPPKYLKPIGCLWNSWTLTTPSGSPQYLRVGEAHYMNHCLKSELESAYPGFPASFAMLDALGGDPCFVTTLLKFGIVEASNEPLDVFFNQPRIQTAIEVALALGLSGEEALEMLRRENDVLPSAVLPSDIVS